jgi:hypothetical protein
VEYEKKIELRKKNCYHERTYRVAIAQKTEKEQRDKTIVDETN